jgi:enterochelin esterase-like enzyme
MNVQLKQMYDNMIDQKLCNPFIVVSPATGTWDPDAGKNRDNTIEQNTAELTHIILPYIAGNYATYAEDGTLEAVEEARLHFAIGGCSNGSLFAYNCGMLANFQYFGNYMCCSGDNCSDEIAERINEDDWKNLPIGYYYCGAGELDNQRNRAEKGFHTICDSTSRLMEGKNATFNLIKASHDWKNFSLNMWNALQVLFPATGSM